MAASIAVVSLVCVLVFLNACSARDGFIKDQSTTRVEFPPRIIPKRPDSPVPTGHLRPLGYQKSPEGKITEALKFPQPRYFYTLYVMEKKPVVFRKALTDVPAIKTWADDNYLKNTYGDIDVQVMMKKEMAETQTKTMKFKQFLRDYHYEDWYLSNLIPQEMMHEVPMPPCIKCGLHKYLEGTHIWLSSGGTASLLHSHADHNLHCVLAGRKDFILIEPQYRDRLAFHSKHPFPEAGHSEIDMDRINMFKYADVANVPWAWSTLWRGDCIYVPAGHLVQVRSHGRSFSTTTHWFPTPKVKLSTCKKDTTKFMPLSDAKFMWVYANGRQQLLNTKLDARNLKRHLLLIMREQAEMTFDLFKLFYNDVMAGLTGYESAETLWKKMTPDGGSSLTRAGVRDIDTAILESVATAVNFPHRPIIPEHSEL